MNGSIDIKLFLNSARKKTMFHRSIFKFELNDNVYTFEDTADQRWPNYRAKKRKNPSLSNQPSLFSFSLKVAWSGISLIACWLDISTRLVHQVKPLYSSRPPVLPHHNISVILSINLGLWLGGPDVACRGHMSKSLGSSSVPCH